MREAVARVAAVAALALALAGCSPESGMASLAGKRAVTAAKPANAQPAQAAPPREAAPAPVQAPDFEARLDGFGPLRLGMGTADAVRAWPGLYASRPDAIGRRGCDRAQAPVDLPYFTLMFDDGRFVAYGGGNDTLVAPGGGRRGMDEAALRALYRDALREARDRFDAQGKLLVFDAGGVAPSRLVFRLDRAGRVADWRVGLRPYVDRDEGCEG